MKHILLFILVFIYTNLSAQSYYYALDSANLVENETDHEEEKEEENLLVKILPQDFNWQEIPDDYDNTIWEIQHEFDLAGQTIALPPKVTLRFTGGFLVNGEVYGDQTQIASKSDDQIFKDVDLNGNFLTEYVKPQWFGAVMDGITDDRDHLVETLAQAEQIKAKVLIEKDMFLDVLEEATKPIYIEDNTWIEGENNPKLYVLNEHSPLFHMALSSNITYKNFTIEWIGKYDVFNMRVSATNRQQALEDYLTQNRNIIFKSTNPLFNGSESFKSMFLFDGAQHVRLENITIKAKDDAKANEFIPFAMTFKSQFEPNQQISNEDIAKRRVTNNITFKNVTFDGALMGLQGTVHNFNADGTKSYRYSDAQNENGNYIGGNKGDGKYTVAPPHLIYLNDNEHGDVCKNIQITNTVDYGLYTGTSKVRPTASGYCVSLTVTGEHENVLVDNYKSYRRDGFLGVEDMTDATFKNIYSEYDSSIFAGVSDDFNNIRFVGELNNVKFENVVIKDLAETSLYLPLDRTDGNNVTMDEVHVYVNKLNSPYSGPFGINGSNNKVINSTFHIKEHLREEKNVGVIILNTEARENGSNNYYEVDVYGWRDIKESAFEKSIRINLHDGKNPNSNYAKVTDISNNYIRIQDNNVLTDKWLQKDTLLLKSGKQNAFDLVIPSKYEVKKLTYRTIKSLKGGITATIGTDSNHKDLFISPVLNSVSEIDKTFKDSNSTNSNRSVHIYSDSDFSNQGQVEIELELVKKTIIN